MDKISIRGARTHNLRNLSLTIPRNKLVVITGRSGSGKSCSGHWWAPRRYSCGTDNFQ